MFLGVIACNMKDKYKIEVWVSSEISDKLTQLKKRFGYKKSELLRRGLEIVLKSYEKDL